MNTYRVFISSTCYDLLDVRAELAAHLRDLGATPVLSDDKLSDFRVHQSANSIETCLVNVDSCNEVLVILDKRYGPKLGDAGFDDVSATHLEYKRAKAAGKPVHVFARDRLEADYALWKKNKGLPFEPSWAQEVELLKFLHEHRRLKAASASNWIDFFTNSLDLKECVSKKLGRKLTANRVEKAIRNNEFPLFDVELKLSPELIGDQFKYSIEVANVSKTPAFNVSLYWEGEADDRYNHQILPPHKELRLQFVVKSGRFFKGSMVMVLEYSTFEGVKVREIHEATVKSQGQATIHGIKLLERKIMPSNDKLVLGIEI